jgi:RNA polymerase sigma factor (sigma-70 family)
MARTVGETFRRIGDALAARDAGALGDAELLQRFVKRADAAAFTALVRRHGPMVLGVCKRLLRDAADADDAFQTTFVLLSRKAGSLGRPERLAGWLFQVAYRTARRARALRARRRECQAPLPEAAMDSPVAEIVWRELRPIFDEELDRLPEKLRLPVVLCFLEGRTKRGAARQLGWPEGTFSTRLQQARELLRGRLARRGVALSAGTFSLALFEGAAAAAMPPTLTSATVHVASLAATGVALTGPVAVLTQGVIHSMYLTKLKLAAALVVAVGVLGGGAGWVSQRGDGGGSARAEQPAAPERPNSSAAAKDEPAAKKSPAVDPRSLDDLYDLTARVPADAQQRYEEALAREQQARTAVDMAERTLSRRENSVARLKKSLDAGQTPGKDQYEFTAAALDVARAELIRAKKVFALAQAERQRAEAARDLNRANAPAAIDAALAEVDVRQAEANLDAAKARLRLKQIELANTKQLQTQNVVSKAEYERAAAEAEIAEAGVKQAEAALERARLILKQSRKPADPAPKIAPPAAKTDPTAEKARDRIRELFNEKVKWAAEAEADAARAAEAEARIRDALESLHKLRLRQAERAKALHDAGALSADELKKAYDALDTAKKRLAEGR